MPETLEVVCEASDCELDMAELHYTHEMDDDITVDAFQCPYCGRSDQLQAIEL